MMPARNRPESFLEAGTGMPPGVLAEGVLSVLLRQDGTTTHLFETLAGGPIELELVEQEVADVPAPLRGVLPDHNVLHRCVRLRAKGHLLLDALSYIALDRLPATVRDALLEGTTPIGHLLGGLRAHRRFRSGDAFLFDALWQAVGDPDPDASRSFSVHTEQGVCMVVGETFRAGLIRLLAER